MINAAIPENSEILSVLQLTVSQEVFFPITGIRFFTPLKLKQREKMWNDALTSGKEKAFLYRIGNDYVGFGSYKNGYHQKMEGAEICSIYVLKEHWGKGIGTELLSFLTMEIMKDPKVVHIYLWTYENNKRTVSFYERNGFTMSGNVVVKHNKTRVVEMSRSLKV